MRSLLDAVREAYEFRDALPFTAALLAGAACGAVGTLLRWRKLVWAGFAVPEAATVGTAFALGHATILPALGLSVGFPVLFASVNALVVVATALAVLWLIPVGRAARPGGERAAAACFLLATTLVVLLLSESPHGTEEVRALATGKTLMFLQREDVRLLAWTMPLLTLLAWLFAAPLAALAFDRDHARAVGHPVVRLEAGFALGFLVLVSLLSPRAGAPFVFATLTLPAAAAERLVARPLPTAIVASLLAAAGAVLGITAAIAWDLPFSTSAVAGVLALSAAAVLARAAWSLATRRKARG